MERETHGLNNVVKTMILVKDTADDSRPMNKTWIPGLVQSMITLRAGMMAIEPSEKPTRMLTWKPTTFHSHIMPRSHDDRFPMPLWETWFCSSLGVPIRLVVLMENPGQCPFRQFNFDPYGDHIQNVSKLSFSKKKFIIYFALKKRRFPLIHGLIYYRVF